MSNSSGEQEGAMTQSPVEAQPNSGGPPELQAVSLAGGVIKVAENGLNNGDPNAVHQALEQIAGDSGENSDSESHGQPKNPSQESPFKLILDTLTGQDVSAAIGELKKSNDPAQKALGYDLEIAQWQHRLSQLNELPVKSDQEKARKQQLIQNAKEEMDKLKQEREQRAKDQPYQLTESIGKLAKDEEEKKEAQENPLGFLQKKILEASKGGDEARVKFLEELGKTFNLSDEEKQGVQELIDAVTMEQDEEKRKQVIKKRKELVTTIGGLMLLLAIIEMWLMMKQK